MSREGDTPAARDRLVGVQGRGWCVVCRSEPGPDCAGSEQSRRWAKRRERRELRERVKRGLLEEPNE